MPRRAQRLPTTASLAERREAVGTFLISLAVLGVQIGWTRIFSFMIWYHFAFLVISMAMLGFTVGGLFLHLRPAMLRRSAGNLLFICTLGFCLSTGIALLAVCNLPFNGGVLDSWRNLALFVLMILLVSSSFCWAGVFISFVIAKNPDKVGSIYAANLIGSGVGCGVSVVLLDHFLPASALIFFALLASIALLFLLPLTNNRYRAGLGATATVAVLGLGFGLSLDPLAEPFYMKSTKPFPALRKDRIYTRYSNSLSTVDLFRADQLTGLWGLSDRQFFYNHPGGAIPNAMGICIDGWAMTFVYRSANDISKEPVFDYLPSSIAYDFLPAKSALIIGSGGGIDVISARRRGVASITAVEINPIIMDLVKYRLARYNGGLFFQKGVETVVADGRGYLTKAGARRWDVIQLSGVDTLSASQAGAFTLAESYLYTREAFVSYLEHLNPGGVLTLTRWMFDPPRHSLRVLTVADETLRDFGIKEPRAHIVLLTDCRSRFGIFLISRTPFTKQHVAEIYRICMEKGYIPLYLPHYESGLNNTYERFMNASDKHAFIREYPFDISVTTDNTPFFFEHSKWRNAWKDRDYILDKFNGHLILMIATALISLLGTVFILIPARYGLAKQDKKDSYRSVLSYFSCLGLGYILVEMVLVQKLTLYLGNPVYALAVVLCAMLVFAGIGSLLSSFVKRYGNRGVIGAVISVVLSLIVCRFGLDTVLHSTLAIPLAARIALALILLALPATLMGIPFPLAVTRLGDSHRGLILRGWILNGYFSVLGACLAMIISISFGFNTVLLVGTAIYATAAASWYTVRESF